jgi:hypothetical protein
MHWCCWSCPHRLAHRSARRSASRRLRDRRKGPVGHSRFAQLHGVDDPAVRQLRRPGRHWPTRGCSAAAGRAHPALVQRGSHPPFIERHPDLTYEHLHRWVFDPDEHVRRLVSEGTRPRLPWAPRLRRLIADPTPNIDLLDLLVDDPSPTSDAPSPTTSTTSPRTTPTSLSTSPTDGCREATAPPGPSAAGCAHSSSKATLEHSRFWASRRTPTSGSPRSPSTGTP